MKTHVDSFEQLLYVNTLRGDDATGMVLVEKNGDFHICKQAVNGPAFSAYAAAILQTIPNATLTKVLFQTEEFDTNSNYASSRFTQ